MKLTRPFQPLPLVSVQLWMTDASSPPQLRSVPFASYSPTIVSFAAWKWTVRHPITVTSVQSIANSPNRMNGKCQEYNPCSYWGGHSFDPYYCGTFDEYFLYIFGHLPVPPLPAYPKPPGECLLQNNTCSWSGELERDVLNGNLNPLATNCSSSAQFYILKS